MISIEIDACRIDILPIVQGLVSEAEKVSRAFSGYEAYGISLGVEAITALINRDSADPEEDFEVNELDLVYANHLSAFGQVEFPCPAFCELVDLCKKDGKGVVALDMNEDAFTECYLKCVKATEFVREHRRAKKGMKKQFDMSSPEVFAKDWDSFSNTGGFAKLNRMREMHIAEQIRSIPKYRRSFLAVVEVERVDGIMAVLRST